MPPPLDVAIVGGGPAGLATAGGVVAGRETSKIFIENGRFHGKKIVARLKLS